MTFVYHSPTNTQLLLISYFHKQASIISALLGLTSKR